ncbi:MBL fold metallo-hydrolase [Pseudoalteromonas sp. OFAV1]|uniref:MBL fold metallo-hydrolase n=1 Tax=Pseudoalteromonas sp. OFAV1 TaxID=2908892 RepID=UPI001F205027|nr:MBL fold metallo-hydrolase [Pseudoalteromonas sp. OFAV1]MCF2902087.1 MBL fold metallo-hydrolase [Pseudoalteromonas sp. OFAV1]
MSDKFYLKPEVYIEPLCNHWYAWPYLIQPLTFARNMVKNHRRLMMSFVKNYKLHMLAKQSTEMVGGEFVNCSKEQLADIKSLIDDMEINKSDLIEAANAISDLENLLLEHNKNESIEDLYCKVPQILKGYVELFVDQNHNASYRIIESLLYESDLYKEELQSVLFGSMEKVENRPFVFSTPRLADDNHLHLNLSFNNPKLRRLLKSRFDPISKQELDEILEGVEQSGGLSVNELFTKDEPINRHIAPHSGVRIQYTGHAGFLIETNNTSILIDPVIAVNNQRDDEDLIGYSELPASINYVLLTHSHQDHVNIETLLQIRDRIETIVVPKNNGGSLFDPSLKLMLQKLDFNVIEVEDMERINLPNNEGHIRAIPFLGEHGDLNIRSKSAWFIEALGKRCYFGADSSNLEPEMYQHIKKITGELDMLAIGMECVGAPYTWLYGALTTQFIPQEVKESRRLNGSDFQKAKMMSKTFNPKEIVIYALGMEKAYSYFMGIDYSDDSEQIVQSQSMVDYGNGNGVKTERAFCRKEIIF